MFLATPQIVSHRIDRWSPMFPPAARVGFSADAHDGDAYHFPGLVFREADREVSLADGPRLAAYPHDDGHERAGSSDLTGIAQLLRRERERKGDNGAAQEDDRRKEGEDHSAPLRPQIKRTGSQPLPQLPKIANEVSEPNSRPDAGGRACGGSARSLQGSEHTSPATGNRATTVQLLEMRKLIKQHLTRSNLEVCIIVEAIDPHSSNTFQARHSYTADDIVFDHSFEPVMKVASDGQAKLDWDLFHKTKESPFNTAQIIGGAHS